ncbi:MAG: type II secretion system GspH family protein [Candidatus Eremiobacteraeota bacterium]|nr:type II secretion system GspH family protein [Candidatus Eremiobacteraeota bacterium]
MKSKGFSIIEIVIAASILLIIVAVTFTIVPNIYKLNIKAWNMSRATYLAQEKLDELTEQNIFIDTIPHTDNPDRLEDCVRSWWGEADPYGNSEIQLIKVKIRWKDRTATRSVEMQSLVAP